MESLNNVAEINSMLAKLEDLEYDDVCHDIPMIWFDADMVLVDLVSYIGSRIHPYHDSFVEGSCAGNLSKANALPREVRNEIFTKYYTDYPRTFAELETLPDFSYMAKAIRILINLGYTCSVLSTVDNRHPDNDVIMRDKQQNLRKHLWGSECPISITLVDSHKAKDVYAETNSILIDDYHRNVAGFIRNGGDAILHSHTTTECTLRKLYGLLTA